MSVRINPSVRLSGADPICPLVLNYEAGDIGGIGKYKYVVEAEEEVLDAFDEFEHYNTRPQLDVEADSVEEAIVKGYRLHQSKIYDERRKCGFMSSGTFIAHVTKVLFNGEVVYEKEPPKHTWP